MAIYLTEADIARLVTVKDAITALDAAFADWRDPAMVNLARQRAPLAAGAFNLMGAAWGSAGVYGLKAYFGGKSGPRYHVLLYSAANGELLAMIEADLFGQLRTGAASGIATRILANADAAVLGVIGSGKQARAQISAVCAVRPIKTIRVHSRSSERRAAFARAIEAELGIACVATDTGEAALAGADVVVTITKSAEPVLRSEWVADGAHINAAGANAAVRRELDAATVVRAALCVTDDRGQAEIEAAEFRDAAVTGRLNWDNVVELGDLVTNRARGRRARSDITIFKSLGVAIEDVAFAKTIHDKALATGAGRPL